VVLTSVVAAAAVVGKSWAEVVEFDIVAKVAAAVDIGAAVQEPTDAVVAAAAALAFVQQKDPFESPADFAAVAEEEGQRKDWRLPIAQLKRTEQLLLLAVEPKATWRLGPLEPIAAVAVLALAAAVAELAAAELAAAFASAAAEGGEIQIQPSEASAPQTGVMPLMPLAADILEAPHIAVADVLMYQPPLVAKPSFLWESPRWNRSRSHRMGLMVGWMMPWLVLLMRL